ncbi:MAG: hypothetical protein JWR72_2196 [Flavisolibacter sp.]|nr:hypothetical protein [Flavisolibacter sp.]
MIEFFLFYQTAVLQLIFCTNEQNLSAAEINNLQMFIFIVLMVQPLGNLASRLFHPA